MEESKNFVIKLFNISPNKPISPVLEVYRAKVQTAALYGA